MLIPNESVTGDGVVGNVGEVRHLYSLVGKLLFDDVIGGVAPVRGGVHVRDGVQRHLVAAVVELVDERVVGVAVADEEGGGGRALVGVAAPVQHAPERRHVLLVHAVLERDHHELGTQHEVCA